MATSTSLGKRGSVRLIAVCEEDPLGEQSGVGEAAACGLSIGAGLDTHRLRQFVVGAEGYTTLDTLGAPLANNEVRFEGT